MLLHIQPPTNAALKKIYNWRNTWKERVALVGAPNEAVGGGSSHYFGSWKMKLQFQDTGIWKEVAAAHYNLPTSVELWTGCLKVDELCAMKYWSHQLILCFCRHLVRPFFFRFNLYVQFCSTSVACNDFHLQPGVAPRPSPCDLPLVGHLKNQVPKTFVFICLLQVPHQQWQTIKDKSPLRNMFKNLEINKLMHFSHGCSF